MQCLPQKTNFEWSRLVGWFNQATCDVKHDHGKEDTVWPGRGLGWGRINALLPTNNHTLKQLFLKGDLLLEPRGRLLPLQVGGLPQVWSARGQVPQRGLQGSRRLHPEARSLHVLVRQRRTDYKVSNFSSHFISLGNKSRGIISFPGLNTCAGSSGTTSM